MNSVKARWLAATVIPAFAGMTGDGYRGSIAEAWLLAAHISLLNPQRLLNLFQRHTFGFRQEL